MTTQWTPGTPGNERAVICAGCGGTYAVCECTVCDRGPGRGGAIFACSPQCEQIIDAKAMEA